MDEDHLLSPPTSHSQDQDQDQCYNYNSIEEEAQPTATASPAPYPIRTAGTTQTEPELTDDEDLDLDHQEWILSPPPTREPMPIDTPSQMPLPISAYLDRSRTATMEHLQQYSKHMFAKHDLMHLLHSGAANEMFLDEGIPMLMLAAMNGPMPFRPSYLDSFRARAAAEAEYGGQFQDMQAQEEVISPTDTNGASTGTMSEPTSDKIKENLSKSATSTCTKKKPNLKPKSNTSAEKGKLESGNTTLASKVRPFTADAVDNFATCAGKGSITTTTKKNPSLPPPPSLDRRHRPKTPQGSTQSPRPRPPAFVSRLYPSPPSKLTTEQKSDQLLEQVQQTKLACQAKEQANSRDYYRVPDDNEPYTIAPMMNFKVLCPTLRDFKFEQLAEHIVKNMGGRVPKSMLNSKHATVRFRFLGRCSKNKEYIINMDKQELVQAERNLSAKSSSIAAGSGPRPFVCGGTGLNFKIPRSFLLSLPGRNAMLPENAMPYLLPAPSSSHPTQQQQQRRAREELAAAYKALCEVAGEHKKKKKKKEVATVEDSVQKQDSIRGKEINKTKTEIDNLGNTLNSYACKLQSLVTEPSTEPEGLPTDSFTRDSEPNAPNIPSATAPSVSSPAKPSPKFCKKKISSIHGPIPAVLARTVTEEAHLTPKCERKKKADFIQDRTSSVLKPPATVRTSVPIPVTTTEVLQKKDKNESKKNSSQPAAEVESESAEVQKTTVQNKPKPTKPKPKHVLEINVLGSKLNNPAASESKTKSKPSKQSSKSNKISKSSSS